MVSFDKLHSLFIATGFFAQAGENEQTRLEKSWRQIFNSHTSLKSLDVATPARHGIWKLKQIGSIPASFHLLGY